MEKIGIDVHKVASQVCILTEDGEFKEFRIRTERDSLTETFGRRARARILLEAATESEWVARHLEALGHEVIVADPNFAPMYASRSRKVKTDKRDARALCEACHLGAYRVVHRVSDGSRMLRKQLASRAVLVQTRSRMISLCRALLRQEGIRVPSGGAAAFDFLSAVSVTFDKSANHIPAARREGEGYAIPAKQHSQRMLKAYVLPNDERRVRTRFLEETKLHLVLPAFEAAPLTAVHEHLSLLGDRVEVSGYLAQYVEGQNLQELLQDGRDPSWELRLRLCMQLCQAIRVLETGRLAHGDLSAANVMIIGDDVSMASLRLIDFDGFYHDKVPVVPSTKEPGGRGYGQDGYRHAAYSGMDERVIVRSDRAALAALAFELVVRNSNDLAILGRDTFLDQEHLDQRKPQIAAGIVARWEEGWALVESAFTVDEPEAAPSPQQWCDLIARTARRAAPRGYSVSTKPSSGFTPVELMVVEGDEPERRVMLREASNSFARFSHRLAWLSYARSAAGVSLFGATDRLVFLVRDGEVFAREKGDVAFEISPGDEIRWCNFVVRVGSFT